MMEDVEEFGRTKKPKKTSDDESDDKKKRPIIKTPVDLQRFKIEKLMRNPDKPVIIPETPKSKDYIGQVPSFVRNVMGSSAGAGSGEFHVYRHLRRKEYARQKHIQAKSMKEELDEKYHQKLEQNRIEAEARTAKKREKRLKKKQKQKHVGKKIKTNQDQESKNKEDEILSDSNTEEDISEPEKEVDAKEKVTNEVPCTMNKSTTKNDEKLSDSNTEEDISEPEQEVDAKEKVINEVPCTKNESTTKNENELSIPCNEDSSIKDNELQEKIRDDNNDNKQSLENDKETKEVE